MTRPGVIFDIDGTLVDTNYQHAIAWYQAFRQHDVHLPVWELHRHLGMGGDQLVASVAGDEAEERIGDDVRTAHDVIYMTMIQSDLADDWTTSDDVEQTKPEPDLVIAAKEKLGQGDAVMVGDTPWDVEAARRSGVPTIAVMTGGFSEAELRDAGAVAVFRSIAQLRDKRGDTALAP